RAGQTPRAARGIDIGTGPNLYPTLSMLPFCDEITLFEFSRRNTEWLSAQQRGGWPSWENAWGNFWQVLCQEEPYRDLRQPRNQLTKRAVVKQGSVYDLGTAQRWNMGTMFFVAES